MSRLSPIVLISVCLVCVTLAAIFAGDAIVGLAPDHATQGFNARKALCENLAVQYSMLAASGHIDMIAAVMHALVERHSDILSAALRTADGQQLAVAGDHVRHWVQPPGQQSTLNHIQVPIYKSSVPWGTLQLSFKPISPPWGEQVTTGAWPRFLGLVAVMGFIGYFTFMRRTLRHLDPSEVIPPRVKAAFDVLSEGVVFLDADERVVLANRAFGTVAGVESADLIGRSLQDLSWSSPETAALPVKMPWESAIVRRQAIEPVALYLHRDDGGDRTLMTGATPIQDDRGGIRGLLVSFRDVTELEVKNTELAKTITELVAAQVELTKKTDELHRMATRDSLTGCLNRRAFFEEVERILAGKAIEAGVGCVMIDIDHFKSFNDTYGHAVGDQVLVSVARTVSASIRSEDLFARYGGEEFCLVLAGVALPDVLQTAERIRHRIATESGAGVRSHDGLRVTASLGVAFGSGRVDIQEFLKRADEALYFAKAHGRNQVARFDTVSGAPCPLDDADPVRSI